MLTNKRLPLVLHILAWAIILFIPRYLLHAYGNGDTHFLNQFYSNTAIYGLIFYLNYLWFVPRFFLNDKKLMYFLLATLSIVLLYFLMWYLNDVVFFDPKHEQEMEKLMQAINKDKDLVKPPFREFRIYNYFYTAILISGFSLGLGVVEKLNQNEKKRKELEKDKLNSELAFLKNQIGPHFFFNTLNNIYSLIGINQDEAQNSVHKLSKLMRYLLYESEHGTTKLSDEIAFMKNYIDLMKLRLNEKVSLEIVFPEKYPDLSIPPLLFIPFIENAFKHGLSYRDKSFIEMEMNVEDTQVLFKCKNSKFPKTLQLEDKEYAGIGLENVKKRLNLLFPNVHHLNVTETENTFEIALSLDVKKLNA